MASLNVPVPNTAQYSPNQDPYIQPLETKTPSKKTTDLYNVCVYFFFVCVCVLSLSVWRVVQPATTSLLSEKRKVVVEQGRRQDQQSSQQKPRSTTNPVASIDSGNRAKHHAVRNEVGRGAMLVQEKCPTKGPCHLDVREAACRLWKDPMFCHSSEAIRSSRHSSLLCLPCAAPKIQYNRNHEDVIAPTSCSSLCTSRVLRISYGSDT